MRKKTSGSFPRVGGVEDEEEEEERKHPGREGRLCTSEEGYGDMSTHSGVIGGADLTGGS